MNLNDLTDLQMVNDCKMNALRTFLKIVLWLSILQTENDFKVLFSFRKNYNLVICQFSKHYISTMDLEMKHGSVVQHLLDTQSVLVSYHSMFFQII